MVPTTSPDAPTGVGRRPVPVRLLGAALVIGAAAAAAAPATYLTVRHERYAALDAVLRARAEQGADTIGADPSRMVQFGVAGFGEGVRPALVYADGVMFLPQKATPVPYGEPEIAVARGTAPRSIRTGSVGGIELRTAAVPVGSRAERAGPEDGTIRAALVLGMPTDPVEDALRGPRNRAAAVMLAGLALGGYATRSWVRRTRQREPVAGRF